MSYKDVREWLQQVDEMGELKVVEGADRTLEIGALALLASKHKEGSPAVSANVSRSTATTRRTTKRGREAFS